MNHHTRETELPDTTWAASGLCKDMPAKMFTDGSDQQQTAKAACAHCPVAAACLTWALTTEIEEDIWGGRTAKERRRLGIAYVQTTALTPPLEPPATAEPQPTPRPAPIAIPDEHAPPADTAKQATNKRQSKAAQPVDRQPKKRTTAPAQCGTESGYKAHRRRGENACAACLSGVQQAQRDREARRAAGLPIATRSRVAACGTVAGYARHHAHNETPCNPCYRANADYLQAYREARRAESTTPPEAEGHRGAA